MLIHMVAATLSRPPFGTHNWTDISGETSGDNSASQWTPAVGGPARITISSVSGSGTLRVRPVLGGLNGTLLICAGAATQDFSVSGGQTWHFSGLISGAPGQGKSCLVTVTDTAHGGAVIDTFTLSLSVPEI